MSGESVAFFLSFFRGGDEHVLHRTSRFGKYSVTMRFIITDAATFFVHAIDTSLLCRLLDKS